LPWTFTAHAKDIFHDEVSQDDLAQKCRDAAAVITVSDFNQSHLRQQFGHSARDIVRVYNGLDLDRLTYAIDGPRTVDVLAVGRLVDKKGFDVLVDACAQLHASGRAITCDIIGEGDREPTLREQIATRGLGGFVRLLGPRPQREVMAALRGAQVFAAPCLIGADGNRDGLPTTILEAMASGTPCIATPVTGIPEAVRPGHTGVLVPCGDTNALAGAIARMLDDPDERRRLARSARSLIESCFDARVTARQLRSVFATSVNPPRAEAIA